MSAAPIMSRDLEGHATCPAGDLTLSLARRLDAAIWVFDIDNSSIVFANASACAIWQADTEAELCARDFTTDMSATVSKRLKQYQTDFEKMDARFTELWTLYPNGEPRSIMVVYRGFRLDDGRMGMLCEAVGEAEDQPENLRSAEALLHTDVMITLFSRDGPPLYLNPAARNTFSAPINSFEQLFDSPDDYHDVINHAEATGEHRLVCRLHTTSGRKWFDLSVKLCSDAATGAPALLVTAIDVTDLKEARDTARHLADRDQLTNLHNRSYLQNHLAWLEDREQAINSTVIFFDIDRFKLINDRFGHEAGDTVLRQIATRARANLRAEDMVARLGGDEFVVVIPGNCSRSALTAQIDRLRNAIARPIQHEKTRIEATISVGVSSFGPQSTSFSQVMREADIALYKSKEEGRNRVTFFNAEMGEAVLQREKLERELKHAVKRGEFVLHYQPRIHIATGKIVGAEGLARWRHPEQGLVPPDVFIPVCEETGLIDELGRLVLEIGCQQAIDWHSAGLDIGLSLNVSPRQFADDRFLPNLARIAARPDFPKGKIELEVTETVLIGNPDQIAKKLKKITAMGYQIAIDDFGTGYSNLSYISRFPLNCLKIDRSFIQQLPESGPIVQLIVTLGQQIGATVVSEGVETKDQYEWLAQHSCEEAQGYYITRALPIEAFEDFVAASQIAKP